MQVIHTVLQDGAITDEACAALNGMQLGEKRLVVQRASVGAKTQQVSSQQMNNVPVVPQLPGMDTSRLMNNAPGASNPFKMGKATEVLCLMNMVSHRVFQVN